MIIYIVRSYTEWNELLLFKNKSTAIRYIKGHGAICSDIKKHLWYETLESRKNYDEPLFTLIDKIVVED